MAEFKTEKQNNYGFPLTFSATGKFPLIAKRIWKTYNEALEFAQEDPTATPGLIVTVFKDGANNGAYQIIEVEEDGGTNGYSLMNLGGKPSNSIFDDLYRKISDLTDELVNDEKVIAAQFTDHENRIDELENEETLISGAILTLSGRLNVLFSKVNYLSGEVDRRINDLADELVNDEKVVAALLTDHENRIDIFESDETISGSIKYIANEVVKDTISWYEIEN